MISTDEYYDKMADVSDSTRQAIESLVLAQKNVKDALNLINSIKKQGDMTISFVSNSTTNDVHRNLLFLELLLNQTFGLVESFTFKELLAITDYKLDEDDF